MDARTATVPLLFVVGSGRSGTTLYQDCLNSFSTLQSFTRLSAARPSLTYLSGLLRQHVGAPESLVKSSGEAQRLLGEAGITADRQRELRRRLVAADARNIDPAPLRKRIIQLQRSARDKSTVVVKNTLNSARVEALAVAFPEAAFHHVVRHPGRVIESLLNVEFFEGMPLWWDGRTVEEYAAEESVTREVVAARHWRRQVVDCLDGLAAVADGRKATIVYADLVRKPEGAARTALRAVGLEEPGEYRNASTVRGERQTEFSLATELAVRSECSDVMTRLGLNHL